MMDQEYPTIALIFLSKMLMENASKGLIQEKTEDRCKMGRHRGSISASTERAHNSVWGYTSSCAHTFGYENQDGHAQLKLYIEESQLE